MFDGFFNSRKGHKQHPKINKVTVDRIMPHPVRARETSDDFGSIRAAPDLMSCQTKVFQSLLKADQLIQCKVFKWLRYFGF